MEIEPKNQSRNFRSEKFVCSDFLAEWKTAFTLLLLCIEENVGSILVYSFDRKENLRKDIS